MTEPALEALSETLLETAPEETALTAEAAPTTVKQTVPARARTASTPSPAAVTLPAAPETPPSSVPSAPTREERRAFSTRLRPSLKRSLDAFVMELKMAGWPVSQEVVLESLVRRLRDDEALRAGVTAELTGPNREG